MHLPHLQKVGDVEGAGGGESRALLSHPLLTYRHSRAFLHALLHSDNTAALHHLTVHNIAYQVGLYPRVGEGRGRSPGYPWPMLMPPSCSCS